MNLRWMRACLARLIAAGRQVVNACNGNPAVGTHGGPITKLADAAITDRHLLGKIGTDEDHIAVCGASNRPFGVIRDEATAAEDPVAVSPLGIGGSTELMVAAEAIADDAEVFTAANGQVQNTPTAAGTYYKVGRAVKAAGAQGDEFEVIAQAPIEYVVPA